MSTMRLLGSVLLGVGLLSGCAPGPTNNPDATPDAVNETGTGADAGTMDDASGTMDSSTVTDSSMMSSPDVYDPFNDPDARSPSTAITATNEQWTWVDFPDSVCGNGSPTGIAVNLTNRSNKVLIYLMGGGACWEYNTCFTLGTAANFTSGYNRTTFQGDSAGLSTAAFFNRARTDNPFRDASYVFVPYCSGDVHSGNRLNSFTSRGVAYPAFFMGARNLDVFLRRLVPTFPNASRVWLAGSSAGGFGAGINWERVQTAFGSTRVDLIDDSGPPMTTTRWSMWRPAWNAQVPMGCTACTNDVAAIVDYYNGRYGQDHRFGLLSYTQDQTISFYFGITMTAFQMQFEGLTQRFSSLPNMHYFAVNGTSHVLMTNPGLTNSSNTTLGTWLDQMVNDSPQWSNSGP